MSRFFPVQESIEYGIKTAWKYLKHIFFIDLTFLLVTLLAFIVTVAGVLAAIGVSFFLPTIGIATGAIMVITLILFLYGLSLGYFRFILNAHDDGNTQVSILFSELSKSHLLLMYVITMAIMVACGFLLLIVPGLILLARFMYVPFILIDTDKGLIQSYKESWNLTKGNTLNAVLLLLLLVALSYLGGLLIIGAFFTYPASLLALAYSYRKLTATTEQQ